MSGDGVRPPDAQPSGARHTLRVAVLARDELDRRRIGNALEGAGLSVADVPAANEVAVEHDVPDVLVVRIDNTTDARRRGWLSFRRRLPGVPAVVVSRRSDRGAIDDALTAGATGFVAECDLDERLGPTVRAVSVGQLAIPAELRASVEHPILSPREKQVMSMVVLGFTNLEVANKLHVTETTVKSHLSSAYRKLRVRSRHEATALILSNRALGLGILTLESTRAPGSGPEASRQ